MPLVAGVTWGVRARAFVYLAFEAKPAVPEGILRKYPHSTGRVGRSIGRSMKVYTVAGSD